MFNAKEYKAKYYQEHKEYSRELRRQWNINNPERYKASYIETPEKKEHRRRCSIEKKLGCFFDNPELTKLATEYLKSFTETAIQMLISV